MSRPTANSQTCTIQPFKTVIFCCLGLLAAYAGCNSVSKESAADKDQNPSKESAESQSQSPSDPPAESSTASTESPSDDWPHFRGADFSSTVSTKFPLEWDVDNGILWKTGLPGRGASTPVISGKRLFLTAYHGFGLTAEDPGDFKELRHHVLCFDKDSGRVIWQREITGTGLLQKMNPELARHGFASSTPVTDGENVYAFFGVTGVFAFDNDGNLLWQRNLGLETHYFGSSASPVIYKNLLIVNASLESKTVYALDKKTGAAVWKIEDVHECWSTPVIGQNADGNDELIISHKNFVAGHNPATGKQLWYASGIQDYVVSVPIVVDGICYLTGGKEKQTMAIRLGGQGEVSESHKLWEVGKIGSNVSSPVYKDGRLYIFHDSGVIQVIDAKTGDVLKRHRTATNERPFASPLLAGKHLYMPFQDAGISVFYADQECEEMAVNDCGEGLPLMASVVPSGNRFYYRNDKYLYCVDADGGTTETIAWAEPANKEVVTTIESFNIDPKRGWSRRYMGFLTPNFESAKRYLIMPYLSVITDEQTEKAREIIDGEKPKYNALRERFEKLQWEELTKAAEESPKFHDRYAELEKETKKLNSDTRILIKKLFPEEQMQQHLRDAEAGIAHIKPEDQKKDEKK